MLLKLWLTSLVVMTLGPGAGSFICGSFDNFELGNQLIGVMWASFALHLAVGIVVATWCKDW